MTLIFPWPAKELSPNSRCHWSKKAKAVKKYREACWAIALQAKIKAPEGPIALSVLFVPPDKRHRDWDNAIASAKALFDGLADALGVNDSRFKLQMSLAPHGVTAKGGEVRVMIGENGHCGLAGGA